MGWGLEGTRWLRQEAWVVLPPRGVQACGLWFNRRVQVWGVAKMQRFTLHLSTVTLPLKAPNLALMTRYGPLCPTSTLLQLLCFLLPLPQGCSGRFCPLFSLSLLPLSHPIYSWGVNHQMMHSLRPAFSNPTEPRGRVIIIHAHDLFLM